MKALLKFVAIVAFFVIGGGLLMYAASRSLDFVQSTLPTKDQVLGYFALLATSGGMVGWLLVFLYRADGIIQRGTALLMVLIDFAGEAALFTMDTLYRSGENGLVSQMTPDEIRTVILGMSALIALNIFATIVFELGRMEVLKEIAEGAARDLVMFKALAQIEKDSETVADEMENCLINTDFAKPDTRDLEPIVGKPARAITVIRKLAAHVVGKDTQAYHLGIFFHAARHLADFDPTLPLTSSELARLGHILLSMAMITGKLEHSIEDEQSDTPMVGTEISIISRSRKGLAIPLFSILPEVLIFTPIYGCNVRGNAIYRAYFRIFRARNPDNQNGSFHLVFVIY